MSADFDPRELWTRREALAAAAAVAAASGATAQACEPGNADALFIAGAGIEVGLARRMAHLADARVIALPARGDAVRFWSAHIAPNLRKGAPVLGLTGWADYLVLRGMAAERRLRMRAESGRTDGDSALAARLRAALDSAPAAAEGRIGWALA